MKQEEYLLTPQGAAKLNKELEEARGPSRQDLAKRLRIAIQHGDLSENADYTAAKEEQAFLEGRIQELEAILRNAVIVEANATPEVAGIGSSVTVDQGVDGTQVFHLVGLKEGDSRRNMVTYKSPIGKALMGVRVGETAVVDTPGGVTELKIIAIEVSPPSEL